MILRTILTLVILLTTLGSYGNDDVYNSEKQLDQILQNNFQDSLKVVFTESRLIIENLPTDNILEIYNIMGAKVYTRRLKSGTNEYNISLPKGYYIIKIGKFTKKIAIK
ncbi:MAG: T9SS type A sorting domain-containing protein [Fermentimonas sp.]|nr:T9SS type A sorting domain-containing protein [Fermentimonas sp.]